MALTAAPLSYNWTIKEFIDNVRAITKEEDEQIVSDDNIRAHGQFAIHNMIKLFRPIRYQYAVDVPFVVNTVGNPLVSTLVRPVNSTTALPIQILMCPTPGNFPAMQLTGLYDFHFEHPTNFVILEWINMWNELTGTCRRTTDFPNLVGHNLGNNTQLSRTIAYYNFEQSNVMFVSVREAMQSLAGTDVIIHGLGIRTPIKMIELVQTTTPSYARQDHSHTGYPPGLNETTRYATVINDYDPVDCPDDYVPLAVNIAAIKVWSQVQKVSKEAEQAQLEAAYGQYFDSSEQRLMEKETYRKDTQYKDRGHL